MSDLLGGGTTTSPSAPTTTSTASAFPTQPISGPTAAFEQAILALAPAEFYARYGITDATDEALYEGISSTGTPTNTLGPGAVWLAWYDSLNQEDRQQIQEQMVGASMLADTAATGINSTAGQTAFKNVIAQGAQNQTTPIAYLQSNGTGTAALQNQISAGLTTAETNAQKPVTATLENPTTLAADLSNAINQELGYTPSNVQALINNFVAQVQGQDVANAEAPRTEAQQQITQAQDEESDLNKLGPDGIDTVVSAYEAAVNKVPGGGTQQGPFTGMNNNATGGTPARAAMAAEPVTPSGAPIGGAPNMIPGTYGMAGAIGHDILNGGILGNPLGPGSVEAGTPRPGGVQNGTIGEVTTGAGTAATMPTSAGAQYGGLFAMTDKEWKAAQKLFPAADNAKYPDPGAAPPSVQRGAFMALMQNEYTQTGSWATAVTNLASGTPVGSGAAGNAAKALGTSIANEVNNQIASIQGQINNSTVTTKVTTPDATAEAAQAAKNADPVGYTAGNFAGWGSFADKMLYGTPLTEMPSASVQFNGPVGATTTENGTPAPATPTPAPPPAATMAA